VIILALETSSPHGSLAVASSRDGRTQILSEEHWNKKSTHSETANLALMAALQKANLKLNDLTHFALDIGPGSFTGLRVGINLVKTLAYGLKKPTLAVSSLEILAFQHLQSNETGLLAIPAIQNLYYFAGFEKKNDLIHTRLAPMSGSLEEIKVHAKNFNKILVEGEATTPPLQPLATDLAHMAATGSSHYIFLPWQDLKPLYVRGSEAEEKLKKASI
jgi:tRNA threonylcarbamoyladenosine biosynthesis protein TsaB